MATIVENLKAWEKFDWKNRGDVWSSAWGSTQSMWERTIVPRIKHWLPAHSVLEIACGMGRCSEHLSRQCVRFTGIDIIPKCLEEARKRMPNGSFILTDGKSIPLADETVDFIFSWDSLVHCDWDTLVCYLAEIKRVLKPGGGAFIHHSNWGNRNGNNPHWRAYGVKAWDLNLHSVSIGLSVEVQEIVSWGDQQWSDAFTTFSKRKDPVGHTGIFNGGFGAEVSSAKFVSRIYASVAQR